MTEPHVEILDLGPGEMAVRLDHCKNAQVAPSPYGVFNVILDGEFLTYQPHGKKGFARLLDKTDSRSQEY